MRMEWVRRIVLRVDSHWIITGLIYLSSRLYGWLFLYEMRDILAGRTALFRFTSLR